MRRFRLGLIINPFSGIGGALALKGSDGAEVREQALSMGAIPQSNKRCEQALKHILELSEQVEIFTASGQMGEDLSQALGFKTRVVYQAATEQTEAEDTQEVAKRLLSHDIDLLLFVGGDGTARNIFDALEDMCPVIGVPAGCKIHSGVYAITPSAAGRVLKQVISGELVSLMSAEVRDIDEDAFRKGKVIAKHYGDMNVPQELSYIQAVKMGGKESDELVLADLAADIIEDMEDNPDTYYVMGSGSTLDFIMHELNLDNTLLGVDVVKNAELIASDQTAYQLLDLLDGKSFKLVITLIGGQGHVFGRGNQQLSPELIKQASKQNIIIVATKQKLQDLNGRPLIADTGDELLDNSLSGPISVTTGYKDKVLYRFA